MSGRVMLLQSEVDSSHCHVVSIPDPVDEKEAVGRVKALLAQVQAENPDFSWEQDVAPLLTANGFAPLPQVLGPVWDSPAA